MAHKVDIASDLFDWVSKTKVSDLQEIVPQHLFDTIELPAAAITTSTKLDFFKVPQSSTKGESQTNMVLANQLEKDNFFIAQGINVLFPNTPVLAELQKVYGAKPYLKLRFTKKDWISEPLSLIPNGYGFSANTLNPSWGGFSLAGSFSFDPFNVFFDEQQQFYVTIAFDGSAAALAAVTPIQVAFSGYWIRPVQ